MRHKLKIVSMIQNLELTEVSVANQYPIYIVPIDTKIRGGSGADIRANLLSMD